MASWINKQKTISHKTGFFFSPYHVIFWQYPNYLYAVDLISYTGVVYNLLEKEGTDFHITLGFTLMNYDLRAGCNS